MQSPECDAVHSADHTELDIDAWFSAFDTLGFYQRADEANEGWSDASRKLCAYPEYPHYIGGDEASADSFECR